LSLNNRLGVNTPPFGADFRQVGAAHIDMQWFTDIQSTINILFKQQLQARSVEVHPLAFDRAPDKLAGGRDALFKHVEAEGVFRKTHNVTPGLGIEADQALQ
jgi:hypothetical protein